RERQGQRAEAGQQRLAGARCPTGNPHQEKPSSARGGRAVGERAGKSTSGGLSPYPTGAAPSRPQSSSSSPAAGAGAASTCDMGPFGMAKRIGGTQVRGRSPHG
ncbi:MAG: hypothetical protein ACK559_41525, partial [bacterium]